ncbi:MAG: hypothetical protein QM743_00655 [Chitinophagaceae bacterium]
MKSLLTAIILLASLYGKAQTASDTLRWHPGCRLQLEDFRAAPETGSVYTAVSVCPIICRYYTDSIADTLCFEVYCFFDRSASWARPAETDAALLAHEQLHFDITECYTRILKAKLEACKRDSSVSERSILRYHQCCIGAERPGAGIV